MSDITSITTVSTPIQHKQARSCNGCTKCCEGWLKAEIKGEWMSPGKPCRFKTDKGCGIYDERPTEPCKTYKCLWLEDSELVPEEFWPGSTNVILTKRWTESNIPYLEMIEAGGKLPVEVLDWAIQNVQLGIIKNFVYTVDGHRRFITSQGKFAEEMMANPGYMPNSEVK